MDLHPATPPTTPDRVAAGEEFDERTTVVDPRTPWTSLVVWFLAAFKIGPDVSVGYVGTDVTRPPTTVRISTGDGSWAEITTERLVIEGGPRALWRMVEDAHRFWEKAGQPGWERFGLTARADGTQHVWLDEPTGPCAFPIVPSGR